MIDKKIYDLAVEIYSAFAKIGREGYTVEDFMQLIADEDIQEMLYEDDRIDIEGVNIAISPAIVIDEDGYPELNPKYEEMYNGAVNIVKNVDDDNLV